MRHQVTLKNQKGIALFVSLIALVILLLAAVALVRSTDTALLISGNFAVKRDLANEAENAVQAAFTKFASSGGLNSESARWSDSAAANYSSSVLPSNPQGVPNILLDTDTAYSAVNTSAISSTFNGVSYRYVIDRLCPKTGDPNGQHCVTGKALANAGGNARNPTENGGSGSPSAPGKVVYRITVRVTDPRQTQSFIQTTFKSFGS